MDEENEFDELDDFSHLPTVDASPSADQKRELWKKHSRRPPPVPGLIAEEARTSMEHNRHEDVHAEQQGDEAPVAAPPPPVPAAAVPDWVREAFTGEQSIEDDAPPATRSIKSAPETIPMQRAAPAPPPVAAKTASGPRQDEPARRELPTAKSRTDDSRSSTSNGSSSAPDESPVSKKAVPQPAPIRAESNPEPLGDSEPAEPKTREQAPFKPPASKEIPPLPTTADVVAGTLDEEPVSETRRRLRVVWDKIGGRALAASLALHAVLLIIAALVIVAVHVEKEVDFLPGGQSAGASEAAASLKHQVQKKKNPWLKNRAPLKRVVSTNISPDITLPEAPPDMMDFPDMGSLMKLGSSGGGAGGAGNGFGKGTGMGGGLGFAGQINFMGNRGIGRNVVFVVDVSGSMSTPGDSGTGQVITRFQLLKIELDKSLSRLPPNTQYQVIYFSDFAWAHNEVDSTNTAALEKARWRISPDKTGVPVPRFRYLNSDSTTVMKSREIIKNSENPGGTNWGSGLFMALKAFPKPDVIFFMTDGQQEDSLGWVDAVTRLNNSTSKRTIIHTTAMMEPSAAVELEDLAKRNGGNFTVVTSQGFIKTADEFFGRKPAEPK